MIHTGPPRSPDREVPPVPRGPARWLRRVGHRAFGVHDAQARSMGLEPAESRDGLRRRYRDPRFDLRAACPVHRGPVGTVCGFCRARFFRRVP
ncbi:hypothetical protein [Actinomadura hibisca]|uniref:hypothetical protein n=1 Tax=Actinomadura hibisca TaxID=68565 RepID=UPI00082A8DF7|nr:hypothetical protein [Actinomadura hibisca]